jgi:hypothetical protein
MSACQVPAPHTHNNHKPSQTIQCFQQHKIHPPLQQQQQQAEKSWSEEVREIKET